MDTARVKQGGLMAEAQTKVVSEAGGDIYTRLLSARQEKNVAELAERLYEFMPAECWMTEVHLAEALGTNTRQIKNAKAYLFNKGRVRIDLLTNGNRKNPMHRIRKTSPINQYVSDEASRRAIKWDLLRETSAKDLNGLATAELLDFYEEIGLQFIPLCFPKFKRDSVYCSCKHGRNCQAIGKHPATAYKALDFSDWRTYKAMRSFWLDDINHNIGFKVEGYVVLDVDFRKGGQVSFGLLEEELGELPVSLSVRTGNGRHIYVQPFEAHNYVEVMGLSGIDVRASGGIVVAPNSVHFSKNEYQWEAVGEPAPLPESWLSFFQGGDGAKSRSGKLRRVGAQPEVLLPTNPDASFVIPEGRRNRTLFLYACRERGKGAKYDHIFDVLSTLNDAFCEPKLPQAELKDITASAMRYPSEAEKRQRAA